MSRPRPSRQTGAPSVDLPIPDKLYFRIGEVSELTGTKTFVLRYWETEFPSLKPVKSPSGHRLYRRQDVEMVREIQRLLYDQGFTIEGARRHLAGSDRQPDAAQPPPAASASEGEHLKAIRRELQSVLTMLSRRC